MKYSGAEGAFCLYVQDSKYLKIGTCPASQKSIGIYGEIFIFTIEISKFSLAMQPEALVNTSGRVIFSSPDVSCGLAEESEALQI